MQFETHFIKNTDYKTVQCNGAFGGIIGNGQINMNIYTDRVVIPQSITLDIDEVTGIEKGEISRNTKNGVVREVQFGVLLDVNVAKSLVEWLNVQIGTIETLQASK